MNACPLQDSESAIQQTTKGGSQLVPPGKLQKGQQAQAVWQSRPRDFTLPFCQFHVPQVPLEGTPSQSVSFLEIFLVGKLQARLM